MRWLLALGACAGLLALGGCGGGDDSASTSSTAREATPTTTTARAEGKSATAQSAKGSDRSSPESSSKPRGPERANTSRPHPQLVRVPPISSAPVAGSRAPAPGVKTVGGADNSVQEYGVEAGAPERREAAIALQAYLNARVEGDWGRACSYLAKRPLEQLERLQSAAAGQGKDLGGCAGALALLGEGEAQLREQARIAEVLSFRGEGEVSGDPSYLLYLAPPTRTLYSMPMYLQGGAWKVGLARPAELPA